MRLTDNELILIRKTFIECFSEQDHLWLFGSRVDEKKRGGDIDFYVETKEQDTSKAISKRLDFIVSLKLKMGDQKIDVVLNQLSLNENLPIYSEAKKTGKQLL